MYLQNASEIVFLEFENKLVSCREYAGINGMRLTRAKAFRQMGGAHVHSCVHNKSVDQLCALLKVTVYILTTCGIQDIY